MMPKCVFLLLLLLLVVSCQFKTITTEIEKSKEEITGERSNWCVSGTMTEYEQQGAQFNTKTIGIEKVTIGTKIVEACHSVTNITDLTDMGGVPESEEKWISEDGKFSKSVSYMGGRQGITENWEDNGKNCVKMFSPQVEESFEQCS